MGFLQEEIAKRRVHDYLTALEKEREKMVVFHRELPCSLDIVSRAIESYRLQLGGITGSEVLLGRSDCNEETSSEGPVLEEFIPTKRDPSSTDDDDGKEEENRFRLRGSSSSRDEEHGREERSNKALDWMRSVQLWNQQPELVLKEDPQTTKPIVVEARRVTGAFDPFHKEKCAGAVATSTVTTPATVALAPEVSSTAGMGSGGGAACGGIRGRSTTSSDEKEGQSHRKVRRCWSPELHRRFLQAIQQLGGPHVATPKQIRELMKVDGLSNDEVKSHLQKYRLHTRRSSPPSQADSGSNSQTTQVVIVGGCGLWAPPPPPEYATSAATTVLPLPTEAPGVIPNALQTPTALISLNQQKQPQQQKQKISEADEDGSDLDSPALSSTSSHTITHHQFTSKLILKYTGAAAAACNSHLSVDFFGAFAHAL